MIGRTARHATDVAAGAVVAAPEVGQLVQVRARHWVVSDVAASTFGDGRRSQHLVELASVEDDGLGHELSVVWEIEPGTAVLDTATLPRPQLDRFDDPARLDAFLDAVRWGAITSADSRALQAPFRSGISIEDYQLDPVVRALQMPRVNLLIADDVGLGKTIEAGLVVQELLLRHRARTVLVVCPASLTLKWKGEMADRFGLEFRIVDAEMLRELRRTRGLAANPFKSYPRLIVSIDWLKRSKAMRLLRDVLPPDAHSYPRRFDLLIVDEVHTCAPAGRGRYARDSQRTDAIRTVSPHFEHRLFLSATPHNGYTESFTALLELLDPQRFARGVLPRPDSLARILVRRLKSELREELGPNADGTPRFAKREIVPLEVAYPADEQEAHAKLARYAALRSKHAGSTTARTAADFVTLLLKKRLFSSPAAFAHTLDVHLHTVAQESAASALDDDTLQEAFARLDDEIEHEIELAEATEDALVAAARTGEGLDAEELELLRWLSGWAGDAKGRPDAKAERLLDWLEATCTDIDDTGDRRWNDERVIVFTEYRDTQVWLEQLLAARGLGGERLALLYGGMDTDARERIKGEFQHAPDRFPLRILLATDAASEGIDLQRYCHRMMHVEIPFSPTRLEQRNGRIDRHGQSAPEVLGLPGESHEEAMRTVAFATDACGRSREVYDVAHTTWAAAPFVLDLHSPIGTDPAAFGVAVIPPPVEEDLALTAEYTTQSGMTAAESWAVTQEIERSVHDDLGRIGDDDDDFWFEIPARRHIDERLFVAACRGFDDLRTGDEKTRVWLPPVEPTRLGKHVVTHVAEDAGDVGRLTLYDPHADAVHVFRGAAASALAILHEPGLLGAKAEALGKHGGWTTGNDALDVLAALARTGMLVAADAAWTTWDGSPVVVEREPATRGRFDAARGVGFLRNVATGTVVRTGAVGYGWTLLAREGTPSDGRRVTDLAAQFGVGPDAVRAQLETLVCQRILYLVRPGDRRWREAVR